MFIVINNCFADHAETIRSVMSNVKLPESCFPAWASVIPEGEWKAKLVSQISGELDVSKDNVVSTSPENSSGVSIDDCCRRSGQDASS